MVIGVTAHLTQKVPTELTVHSQWSDRSLDMESSQRADSAQSLMTTDISCSEIIHLVSDTTGQAFRWSTQQHMVITLEACEEGGRVCVQLSSVLNPLLIGSVPCS